MTQTESPERIADRLVATHNGVTFNDSAEAQKHLRKLIAQALADERRRVREECAGIADAMATCGCEGKHGYCLTDSPAKALASAIRAAGNV